MLTLSTERPMSSPFQPGPPQEPKPFGPPNVPPYGAPPPVAPYAPYSLPTGQGLGYQSTPTRLSLAALFSLLSAVFAPLLSCLCIPTIVLSLTAVVLGHIGLAQTSRSYDRRSGKGLAIGGLVLGYLLLLVSGLCAIPFFAGLGSGGSAPAAATNPAKQRMDAAERKIIGDSDGTAHGNSDEAIRLAIQFATTMKTLREELFEADRKGAISLTGGNFVTYCELRPGKCAFLVHVPAYRKFTDDAKESLAELAWMTAQRTVADKLQDGDDLGVGLKGTLLYGSVMVGDVSAGDDAKAGLAEESTDESQLIRFFEEDAAPQADQVQPADKPPTESSDSLPDQPPQAAPFGEPSAGQLP